MTSTASPVTWTRESIRALLFHNPKAVERAILALYARQTSDEKSTHAAVHRNGQGFGGGDAPYFTKIAKQIQAGRSFTAGERFNMRQRIVKYSGQLLEIALENQLNQLCQPSGTQQAKEA